MLRAISLSDLHPSQRSQLPLQSFVESDSHYRKEVWVSSKKHDVTVSDVEELSPRLRRLRLSGKKLRDLKWSAGDKVKIRICGKSRSYTPSAVNADIGWMDIVFFTHGNGPLSRWAAKAEVGMPVAVSKPEKSMKPSKKAPAWALFLGDETTLGLSKALLSTLPSGTPVLGAIELNVEDAGALAKLGLPLSAAIRLGHHGDALIDWLGRTKLPEGKGAIWISGESVTVQTLKEMLDNRPLAKTTVKTKSYWKSKHRKVCTPASELQVAAI